MFHTELSRDGPGLMLRDILSDKDEQVQAVIAVIAEVDADVVVLAGIDWDHGGLGLAALNERLGYAHALTARPNRGKPSGLDIDDDGRLAEPEDAVGFASFTGQEGLAVVSRLPLALAADHSSTAWGRIEGGLGPPVTGLDELPVSTTAHWEIAIESDPPFRLLTWHATPPVFDGPEDRNGRRNNDEAALSLSLLDKIEGPVVVAAFANLDLADGDGRGEALARLVSHPRMTDPAAASLGGKVAAAVQGGVNDAQRGDPGLDTADWSDAGQGPGNLRVDYLLTPRDYTVVDAGVLWPEPGDALLPLVETASRHRIVWVDLALSDAP